VKILKISKRRKRRCWCWRDNVFIRVISYDNHLELVLLLR